MQIVLTITRGPAAGRQIIVDPGTTVSVGRCAPADYIIAADEYLSSVHFAVTNKHDRCIIADLGSRNGVIVNGNKVQELALEPKDTIAAGSSRFVTDFLNTSREIAASSGTNVGAIPAQAPDTSTIASCAQLDETQRAIVETFALLDGTLYCILDAAQDDMIIELLHCSNAEYQILYEGASAKDLASFGPYLVKLPPQNSFLPGLIKNGWGKNWGVYLKTNAGFAEVRKHLRHFLTVKTPEGKQVYFRFYDPRIMRMVVAGFNSEESALFFGPIHSYLCESSEPSEVLRLSAGPQGVETRLYRCTGKTAVPLESEAFSLAVRGGRSTR